MPPIRIGHIQSISRYPIKSMAGVELNSAMLGWHGLAGDRRFGIRRVGDPGGFPWISASKMAELLLYRPCQFDGLEGESLPTRVRTPSGELFEILGDSLRQEIAEKIGFEVEVMKLKHGIFDDAPISLIATETITHVCKHAGITSNPTRFRANLVVALDEPVPFAEDEWTGRVIRFGGGESSPSIYATKRDLRCMMIGLDPSTAEYNPSVLKSAVELNNNYAGVYGAVISTGTITVGDEVFLSDS